MEKNIGMFDRGVRNILAVTVVALYYFQIITGNLIIVLGGFAFYLTLTSMVSFCPFYYLFKINTISEE